MKTPTLLVISAFATIFASVPTCTLAASVHQDWVRRYYGGPIDNFHGGTPLGVGSDTAGNVFVTGQTGGSGGHGDFYTAKYAGPGGTLLWERRYDGPSAGEDTARALVLDAGGHVIVTGSSAGAGGNADFYTAKYRGSDGKVVWENRYNGLANGADEAQAMAIDAAGAILVTGTSTGPGGSQDLCTVKYAGGDGALLWQTRLSGTRVGAASPAAIAVDAAGNVIVTGTAGNFAYTAKYARASGALLWERLSGGPAGTAKYNKAVATDPAGNVIVTGSSYVIRGHEPYDFTPLLTAKYAATTGATLWERSEQDTYGGLGVTTNAAGDVFVSGGLTGKYTGGSLNNAVKYAAANGALLWKKNLGFEAPGVVVDVQGNATFGGWFQDQEGPIVFNDLHVTRLAGADGALLWTQTYDKGGYVNGGKPLALTPDGGAVLVAGSSGDFTTVKYAPLPSTPLTSVAAASGNVAPSAGVPGGLPAGAKYTSFGIPAINDEGLVAFVASTSSDTILVAGDAVLARVGQPAPGIAGAKFTALGDPVIGAGGRVAFMGRVSGGGSNTTNDAGIWIADGPGRLFLFVRTGDAPLGAGPRFESFRSISISNDDVRYVAKFVDGPGGATAANDLGVWRGFYEPLLRTGSQIPVGGGTKTLLSFKALDEVAGSPGHGRNDQGGILSAALAFTDGTSAIAAPVVGNLRTGQSVNLSTVGGTITGARWKSFGIPSHDDGPAPIAPSVAFSGVLETGFGGVTATRSTGLFVAPVYGAGAVVIARTADPVPGLPGVTFASFLDPVANIVPGREMAVAAVATLAGAGVSVANDTALIVGGSAAPGAEVLARQGDAAPGAAGTQWGNFPLIVQPAWTNAGPLFVAQLQGNATPANNVGLWSADWSGNISLLLRRGSLVTVGAVSKKVAGFTVLSAVPGSPGVARSYNAEHHVVVRAVFTDSTQALLRITAP